MIPRTVSLPDRRIWLRVAKPDWEDPLDPSYARDNGGRWNPPRSFPVLYLNADVVTARLQIERMCEGTPVTPDDLLDDAYVLAAATLPPAQSAADAVSDEGLRALALAETYPLDRRGARVSHSTCSAVGAELEHHRIRGIWCRSACTDDGRGRELAWFSGTQNAGAVWDEPLPFGSWRYANSWQDIKLRDQPDPV